MDYVIEEVFDIICDIDKVLTVKFKLESDDVDQYREILDSDYFEWCYEKYLGDGKCSSSKYVSYIKSITLSSLQ